MKIVNVEDFFHPDAGYQINILPKLWAKSGHDVYVITPELSGHEKDYKNFAAFWGFEGLARKDSEFTRKTGVKIIRVPIYCRKSGRAFYKKGLFNRVKELNPDILFIHNNESLAAMSAIRKIKSFNHPVIFDSHMLRLSSMNRFSALYTAFYRNYFAKKIIKNGLTVVRMQDDNYVEQFTGIPLSQSPFISVGSDTDFFMPDDSEKEKFRAQHNLKENEFVVLYCGKINPSKGALLLADAFAEKLEADGKEAVLWIVGSADGQFEKEFSGRLGKSETKIIRDGTQPYLSLSKIYQAADLCVFPRQSSLSFYDAGACGIPVISEENKVNSDRASHGNGLVFKNDDVIDFRKKILDIMSLSKGEYELMCENSLDFVHKNFDYRDIADEFIDLFEKMIIEYKDGHKN